MAEDDAEILVKIEPEGDVKTNQDDTVKVVTKAIEPAEDLAEQFKAEAESSKRRAEAAEQRERTERQAREAADRRADAAVTTASESQFDTVSTGLAAAQGEAEAATAAYQTAMEAGDFAAAAKAQRRMASAEAKIGRLDEAKADLEARKAEKPERAERAETRTAPADPVEAYISNRTEPTAKWLREHREFVTDPKKNITLTKAHFDALDHDLVPDTPEYFAHVETVIGLRKSESDTKSNGNGQQAQTKRRATVPVAPVQQSGGGTNGGGREVRLSQREAAAAQDGTHVWNYDDPSPQKRFKKGDPLGVQEFARRKLEMTKQGLYDRTFTES